MKSVKDRVCPQIWVWEHIMAYIDIWVEDHVGVRTWGQIRSLVWDRVADQVWDQIEEAADGIS